MTSKLGIATGQRWRCLGGGEWNIIGRSAGAWVGAAVGNPVVKQRWNDAGHPADHVRVAAFNAADLVELLTPAATNACMTAEL